MAVYIARRVIISLLLFFMFIVTNICNNVLNITIVSMVHHNTNSTSNITSPIINSGNINDHKLHWDALSIATVQGAFFLGYCLTKLPGGLLSRRYGSRKVLMISTFITGVASCFFPTAAKIHPIFAFFIRAIIGLTNGVTWPSAIHLGTIWIPKCERSFFSSIYHGNGLATIIFFPISGFIIDYYGWESMFYLSGTLCFIWLIFWYYYAYDSPNIHPTISYEEKAYLESEIMVQATDTTENKKNKSLLLIPWKSILTSPPFWATAIYMHGTMWCMITLNLQLPKYFTYSHNVNIKTSGIMVGLPGLCKIFSGALFGFYMDSLIKKQKFSITSVRKIATVTSKIIPGIILLILAMNTHSDYLFSVLLISIFYTFNGTASTAGIANLSDIAPNFAVTYERGLFGHGHFWPWVFLSIFSLVTYTCTSHTLIHREVISVITGLIQSTIGIPGILSPLLYSSILSLHPSNGWLWIFIIIACIEILSGILFLIFGNGKVQNWNDVKKINADNAGAGEIKKFIEIKK